MTGELSTKAQRSLARSTALLERLRRSGDLRIGATEAEQLARYRAEHPEEFAFEGLCRRLVQDLKIAEEREVRYGRH